MLVKRNSTVLILVVFSLLAPVLVVTSLEAQSLRGEENHKISGTDQLRQALSHFSNGAYSEALLGFREIILDSSMEALHSAAFFWSARSQMALEHYDGASGDLEYFLETYPESSFFDEARYWKGRLLYLQDDLDGAIKALYDFIESYPEHQYIANAYFWIGESLYSLGHLEKAERVFHLIVSDYPSSFKVEASRYRLNLLELKKREEELMRLLKISHEEYLSALEEFQRREKAYDQAIAAYQRKLTALTANDKEALVQELSGEIETKDTEIASLNRQIEQLKAKMDEQNRLYDDLKVRMESLQKNESSTPVQVVQTPAAEGTGTEELLELKVKALELKEFYIEWLLEQEEM